MAMRILTPRQHGQFLQSNALIQVPEDFLGTSWVYADVDEDELVKVGNSFRLEVFVLDGHDWRLDAFVEADTGPHHLLDKFGNPLAVPAKVGFGVPPGSRGEPRVMVHDYAGKLLRVKMVSDQPMTYGLLHELAGYHGRSSKVG